MDRKLNEVVIVGGGAAGLMAGVFAGVSVGVGAGLGGGGSVLIVDGSRRPGVKIRVSGGGRCNVTNQVVTPGDYRGSKPNQIRKVLLTFPVEQTIAFFGSIGVKLKCEQAGKLFPVTDQAGTVLDGLMRSAAEAGVKIKASCKITSIEKSRDVGGFVLSTGSGDVIMARKVILATGGLSLPDSGSDGTGFRLASSLGHSVTECHPALVPLVLAGGCRLRQLSGVSLPVKLRLKASSGKVIAETCGQMLVTHFGVSGPAVLDISRYYCKAVGMGQRVLLVANLVGDHDSRSMDALLLRETVDHPRQRVKALLRRLLVHRLAEVIFKFDLRIDPETTLSHLSRDDRRNLVELLTSYELPVTGSRGYDHAEVTAGGVPLDELSLHTLESRYCPGLYLCGEMLDVDGRLGGFNFQWAWSTGRLAGLGSSS